MRIKITLKRHSFGEPITLSLSVYDSHNDIVAREERDIGPYDLDDGEHFNFPHLKLAGIDVKYEDIVELVAPAHIN